MKLAEALILRADCQKRIAQLKSRLLVNAKVQEGDAPASNYPRKFNTLLSASIKVDFNKNIASGNLFGGGDRTRTCIAFRPAVFKTAALPLCDPSAGMAVEDYNAGCLRPQPSPGPEVADRAETRARTARSGSHSHLTSVR